MDRDRLYAGAVVAFFLVFAGLAASQRYTVTDPWKTYSSAVQQFMTAGLRGDSAALRHRSARVQPVSWMLGVARRQPAMVNAWAHQLEVASGQRRGDTVIMLLWADNVEGCSHTSSISASLLNRTGSPRLLSISSPCVDRQPLPALPW